MSQSWIKAHDSSKNTFWENYPSIDSPITDNELNRNEVSVDTIDDRVITLDTIKAEQSDMLLAFKNVSLDETTGVITFTLFNNTTKTIDTSLEKIATNFRYINDPSDPHYEYLELTLVDSSKQYVDLRALITQYEFTDSSTIDFTVANDGTVTATVIDGSITESKLQPNFLADCRSAKAGAESAEADAIAKALVSEGYANGKQNGVPVTSESPYYHNNAEYFKDQASAIVGSKVDSFNGRTGVVTSQSGDYTQDMIGVPSTASVGQVPTVRNVGGSNVFVMETPAEGLKPHFVITSDTGSTVTVTKGGTTYTATETSTGIFECNVADYGTYTVSSVLNGDTATATVSVDSVKVYNVDARHFYADITVTFPNDGTDTVTLTLGGTVFTATSSPYTFTVHDSGNWVLNREVNGSDVYTKTITASTSGQTFSEDIPEVLTLKNVQNALDNYRESSVYNVGDEIPITVDNATWTMQVGNIDSTNHTIDFVSKNLYNTSVFETNYGYYSTSTPRANMTTFYNKISANEKAFIKQVTKSAYKSGSTYENNSDYVWIPSLYEVVGSYPNNATPPIAQTQFAIFTTQTNRVKKYNGNKTDYWLRDTNSGSTQSSYKVTTSGTTNTQSKGYSGNGNLPCFTLTADS